MQIIITYARLQCFRCFYIDIIVWLNYYHFSYGYIRSTAGIRTQGKCLNIRGVYIGKYASSLRSGKIYSCSHLEEKNMKRGKRKKKKRERKKKAKRINEVEVKRVK
jgi:hypothetical protein